MSTKLQLNGLAELRSALRNLPDELKADAQRIVTDAANGAAVAIRRGYPVVSGKLRDGIDVAQVESSRGGVTAKVTSRARHSHLFENGTGQRRAANGANRGRMPKAPTNEAMIPVVIRQRRTMVTRLIDLVKRAGFVVEQG